MLDVAHKVCTPAELDLLALLVAGYTVRGAAGRLGITREAARRRLERARLRIKAHLAVQAKKENAA